MTGSVYWDTSALLKLYAAEADSSDYFRLLVSQTGDIVVSQLHRTELYFSLQAKEMRGEITSGSGSKQFAKFEQDISEGRYICLPLGNDVSDQARDILDQCTNKTPPIRLRSLDGIHLGAMASAKVRRLVTADIRMREAAEAVGIKIERP